MFKLKRVEVAMDENIKSKNEMLKKLNNFTRLYVLTIFFYFVFTLVFLFIGDSVLMVVGAVLFTINVYLILLFLRMGLSYMKIMELDKVFRIKIQTMTLFLMMAALGIVGDFYRSIIAYVGAYLGQNRPDYCQKFSQIRYVFEWIQMFQLYFILTGVNLIMIFFAKK